MAERKNISKRVRFEVFKRDSFTCQYCGRMSPDVVLEIDHIDPVKNGGDNKIINLVTSCYDCNRGKGAKTLTDHSSIKLQQSQLKELNQKREQLKMLVEWKKELQKFEEEQISIVESYFLSTGGRLTNPNKKELKSLIKKYSISEVIESTIISLDKYWDDDKMSIDKAFHYISKVCSSRKLERENPMVKKINYLRGILRNRFGRSYEDISFWDMVNTIKIDSDYADLKEYACACDSIYDFISYYDGFRAGV